MTNCLQNVSLLLKPWAKSCSVTKVKIWSPKKQNIPQKEYNLSTVENNFKITTRKPFLNELFFTTLFFGISWRVINCPATTTFLQVSRFTAVVYCLSIYIAQIFYCSTRLISIWDEWQAKPTEVWPPILLRLGQLLCWALSIYGCIIINTLNFNELRETLISFTNKREFVEEKKQFIRNLSKIVVLFCAIFVFVALYFKWVKLFGMTISASNVQSPWILNDGKTHVVKQFLQCGRFWLIFELFVSAICYFALLMPFSIFFVLLNGLFCECKCLLNDIYSFPNEFQSLDLLVYRYQSIERSIDSINRHFSTYIFIHFTLFLTIIFVQPKKYLASTIVTTLYESEKLSFFQHLQRTWQMKWDSLDIDFSILCTFLAIVLVLIIIAAIRVNEKLVQFRRASNKFSDISQICSNSSESIQLLNFMLRLSSGLTLICVGNCQVLNGSGTCCIFGCAITRQNLSIIIIFGSLIYFLMAFNKFDDSC